MRLINLLVILIIFFLAGCQSCVDPGIVGTNSLTTVPVPFKPEGLEPQTTDNSKFWVDSGFKKTAESGIGFTVTGAIDYCAVSATSCASNPNCDQVQVPAVFCKEGGTGPQCANPDRADPLGYYVSTKLKVLKGDKLKLSLLPQNITIDCSQQFFDANNIRYDHFQTLKDPNGNKYNFFDDICLQQSPVIINNDSTNNRDVSINLGPYQGKVLSYIVNDQVGPLGNKVCISQKGSETQENWKIGQIDLAPFISPTTKEDLFKLAEDCRKSKATFHFNSYLVNYWCGNICLDKECGGRQDLYYTLLDNTLPSLADMINAIDNNSKNTDFSNFSDPTKVTQVELLAVKIGNSPARHRNCGQEESRDANSWCSGAHQCLGQDNVQFCTDLEDPNHNIYLKLNTAYEVKLEEEAGNNPQEVRLGISDCYRGKASSCYYGDNAFSGYNVQIERDCTETDGVKLCLYIGDTPPTFEPTEANVTANNICCINSKDIAKLHSDLNSIFFSIQDDSSITMPSNAEKVDICQKFKGASGNVYLSIQDTRNSDTLKQATVSDKNAYEVTLYTKLNNDILSKMVTGIVDALIKAFYGVDKELEQGISSNIEGVKGSVIYNLYKGIVTNLSPVITVLLTLMVSIYGGMFLLGLVKHPHIEVLIRLIKFAFIAALLIPEQSWNFFAVTIFDLIVIGTQSLIGIFTGNQGTDFAFLDNSLGAMFLAETWVKILSLLLAGPIGWIFFILLVWGVFILLSVLFKTILVYLMTIIIFSLVLLLAPIFITFLLSQQTKYLFDAWLALIVKSAVEPIMLFAAIYMMNDILMLSFFDVINFGACPDCLIPIEIVDGIGFCLFQFVVPMGHNPNLSLTERMTSAADTLTLNGLGYMGLPVSIVAILKFVIVAKVLEGITEFVSSAAKDISGTMYDLSITAATHAQQAIAGLLGMDENSIKTRSHIRSAAAQGAKDPQKVEFTPQRRGVPKQVLHVNSDDRRGPVKVTGTNPQGRNFEVNIDEEKTTFVNNDKSVTIEKRDEGAYRIRTEGQVLDVNINQAGIRVENAERNQVITNNSDGSITVGGGDFSTNFKHEADGSTVINSSQGLSIKISEEGAIQFGEHGHTLVGVREDAAEGLQFVAPPNSNLRVTRETNDNSNNE